MERDIHQNYLSIERERERGGESMSEQVERMSRRMNERAVAIATHIE